MLQNMQHVIHIYFEETTAKSNVTDVSIYVSVASFIIVMIFKKEKTDTRLSYQVFSNRAN